MPDVAEIGRFIESLGDEDYTPAQVTEIVAGLVEQIETLLPPAIEQAIAAEREACANLADDEFERCAEECDRLRDAGKLAEADNHLARSNGALTIGEAIRARSNP